MKKALFLLLKVVVVIIVLIVVFLATVFTVNVVSNKLEKGKIESYGQLIPVDGKNMNVMIQGQGEETVVLLPGFGTAAPGIDFKPLVDELSPFYKVVVIEPFGYGLSDITEKERTVDNIVSELHEALQQLKIDRYILMGHSISGIYGLDYVNKYKNEVSAFVGIDSSVPAQGAGEALPTAALKSLKQSGFFRLLVKIDPNQILSPNVDDKTKEQNRMITLKNMMNPNIINEAEHFPSNFKATETLKFPKDLPVLFFLVKDTTDVEGWEALHEDQIKDSLQGKMILLEGDHYLHHTRSKEIVQNFRSFMNETK
ncbi:alpha/beta hydrolase [Paenibacillus sp. VTT E-133280]|uniref:alpha/beta fold hydrolase n=1 Tax=Paenibacillus sp. VTT E-133280 TaxID=1986222 RepID=UPI000BA109C1|nr:alpha/beta hydrolase [Paenibacillus sp. VTT E-133280]OZQ69031.1 alpha/beta hydrolase [Paenibacillus sp. VTT E-133280]